MGIPAKGHGLFHYDIKAAFLIPDMKSVRDKRNKAYNGTPAAHRSLSNHHARKKGLGLDVP
jgi:hypothetical protein